VVHVCVPANLPHSGASDPVKEFTDTIAVNLIVAYALSQFVLPHMPAGNSSIIHMSSTRAHQSEPDTADYSASKAGLCGLTHSQVAFSVMFLCSHPGSHLATELYLFRREFSTGSLFFFCYLLWQAITLAGKVRVNTVLPNTDGGGEAALRPEDHAWHPVGRVGVPQDVVEMCLFLCDEQRAGFLTGQEFVVDGGVSKKMVYPE
jgi:NAD(P)-dependent dehydrogenase (short-subunit alcohol dehydrogenase family)